MRSDREKKIDFDIHIYALYVQCSMMCVVVGNVGKVGKVMSDGVSQGDSREK